MRSVILCLLFSLAIASYSLAGGPPGSENGENVSAKGEAPDAKRHPVPGHCLQELVYDYPGPNDLYLCLTYSGTDCSGAVEEYWYGAPTHPLVQKCEDDTCEPLQRKENEALPGHGLQLNSDLVWKMIEAGLWAAKKKNSALSWGKPEYHSIPSHKLPRLAELMGDFKFIAVPIRDGRFYLCMQLDSLANGQVTPAEIIQSRPGTGRQLAVTYRVNDSERKANIWLK